MCIRDRINIRWNQVKILNNIFYNRVFRFCLSKQKFIQCIFYAVLINAETTGKMCIRDSPKTEYAKRDIWTADMIRLALDKCTDSKLYVAMNLKTTAQMQAAYS